MELINYGWYKDMVVKVTTQDGKEIDAQTEGLREEQSVNRKVNGKKYKTFLNPLKDFLRNAKRSREKYLARFFLVGGSKNNGKAYKKQAS